MDVHRSISLTPIYLSVFEPVDRYTQQLTHRYSTSTQLGYTVPFTLENTGHKTNQKYRRYSNQTLPRKSKQYKNTAKQNYTDLVTLDWIVPCFTSPPTQYRLYGRRFLQVKRPKQQYQSTEGKSKDTRWACSTTLPKPHGAPDKT